MFCIQCVTHIVEEFHKILKYLSKLKTVFFNLAYISFCLSKINSAGNYNPNDTSRNTFHSIVVLVFQKFQISKFLSKGHNFFLITDDKFKYESTTPLFVITLVLTCLAIDRQFTLIGEFHDKSL